MGAAGKVAIRTPQARFRPGRSAGYVVRVSTQLEPERVTSIAQCRLKPPREDEAIRRGWRNTQCEEG